MESEKQIRKALSLSAELAEKVDDFRFSNRFRTDTDALRVLIERGLEASRAEAEGREGGGEMLAG